MGLVQGVCSCCGKKIRRESPVSIVVTCDCYRVCPLCGEQMEPYAPDLSPRTYRNENCVEWDPFKAAERDERSTATVYVCRRHDPPFYSNRLPVEVLLK